MADQPTSTLSVMTLRDIQGIDPVSWWPLAPGWWLLLAAITLLLASIIYLSLRLIRYPPGSWKSEAREALVRLRRHAKAMPDKQVAAELSDILRRSAITHAGRSTAAGLRDDAWLSWLSHIDPNQFDWQQQGRILLTLPYAPDTGEDHHQQLTRLINAALRLIAHCYNPPLEADRV
ncbi:MAG: DUF4381 domain-containing protein [Chromatiales bacterium]|nr:DUF4381 domain-containing protein [Chromatiales bacterium]